MYASVSWEFILQCFAAVSIIVFHPRLVKWVRTCLITPKFAVAINDSLASYFEGNKGLRQEDPLPPYLFVLAMEVFSRLILELLQFRERHFQ